MRMLAFNVQRHARAKRSGRLLIEIRRDEQSLSVHFQKVRPFRQNCVLFALIGDHLKITMKSLTQECAFTELHFL